MQKIIYHIHDECCKHSTNKLEETVAYALKAGYKELYFTEHNYVTIDCFYQSRRASWKEIANYRKRIDAINKKCKGKLHCYFGFEIEFNKANRQFLERLARDKYADFLIFGNHFLGDMFKMHQPLPLVKNYCLHDKDIKEVEDNQKAAMASHLFSWAAHPEIWLYSWNKWDAKAIALSKKIIKWAIEYKLPLAFNVNFKDFKTKPEFHYPVKQFWQLVAKTNIPVIIESDSHDIHTIKKGWLAKAKQLALSYGLKNNLVDKLEIKWLPKHPAMFLVEDKIENIPSKILQGLKKDNCKILVVNKDMDITKFPQAFATANACTAVLVKSEELIKQVKSTSMYLISNNDCDLKISQIKKLTYSQFLKKYIKLVK